MRIQHNIMAMNAYRNYNNNTSALAKNLERLSSGYKINRAGDDAAGLAISEKMRAQISGLEAAQKNVKDGVSLVNTAEGAMQEIQDMLNRMVSLATQSANGTYDDEVDRKNLQNEIDQLRSEINRIADSANFNGIKLLDGSLDEEGVASITTEAVKYEPHAAVKGITVGDVENGGGSNGKFTISMDKLFGDSDSLTITWGAGSAFDSTKASDSEGGAATANLKGNTKTLTFGTDFEGETREDQAASIAEALSADADISAQFDIEVQGSKVILTNKYEGNDQATVDKVEADSTNVKAALDSTAGETTSAAAGTGAEYLFDDILTSSDNGGVEFEVGDTLTLEIEDANGNTWTAKLEITEDLRGTTDEDTAANIVTAFADVYFENNAGTVADESTIKVGDMFTVSRDDGTNGSDSSLKLEGKDGGGVFVGGTASLKSSKGIFTAQTSDADSTGVAGTAAEYSVLLDTAAGADSNFSIGDKLTIAGSLSDGRSFSLDLVAGTDFDIGSTASDSMDNIVSALAKSKNTIDIEDDDGNVESVALNKIFSNSGNGGEILVSNTSGTLKFTSQVEGDTFNGSVTNVTLTPADSGALSTDLRNGVQKTAASSSITFDSELEEGATATVNGTTYQFVTDASKAEEGNTAIVVADLTDSAAVAQAFADQLTTDAGSSPAYTAAVDGSTVTITTTDKGQDVSAITIEGAGASHMDAVFKIQPNKLKDGSTITVNDQTFEFVDAKNADSTELSSSDSIRVVVDMENDDAVAINQALKDAIEAAGVGEISMEDDGTLRICGDGEIDPSITFQNGKALTLQIGDTSDSYNQLAVSIGDMHTWAMGIDNINIGSQEGAQAAIDVIKNAINYVSEVRGTLGAISNRLDHTANNLSVMAENITDAESTIRDTDIAEEMMAYTKNNILVQSAQAMLAQANQVPQGAWRKILCK